MKQATILLVASAALAQAQGYTYDEKTGKYTCSKLNAAYCIGDSMKTDIILRCDNTGNGQPGRCSDNLAGEPPVGVKPALCWQTDLNSGDAACEKNCVVYGGSGNANGTFTLPSDVCLPSVTAEPTTTSTVTFNPTGTDYSVQPTTTITYVQPGSSSTPGYPSSEQPTTTSTYVQPTGTGGGGGGGGYGGGNGTCTSCGGSETTPGNPTNTPVQPTTTGSSTIPTAGATANRVGGVLAVLGLVGAYLL